MSKKPVQTPKKTFDLSAGLVIELVEIPPFEMQMVAQSIDSKYPVPDIPSYTIELPGGGTEIQPYTAEIIADDTTPPEDKKKWAEYTAIVNAANVKRGTDMNDYMLMAGTAFQGDPPTIDHPSLKRLKRFGVPIPDDPDDLRVMLIKATLQSNQISELLTMIMQGIGVDEALTAEVKAAFLDPARNDTAQ